MKVVILAGGFGTRISEESHLRPKPMMEIGDRPILWHILKIYSHFGFNEFIICLGYKGFMIKEFFANYYLHTSDVTFDFSKGNEMTVHRKQAEPWKITLVDTGMNTMTGGRIKQIENYVKGETFMMTYGDGVGDVNIPELVKFHKSHNKVATVTAVQPSGRFGALNIEGESLVYGFQEKPKGDRGWINAGYFVLSPEIFKYLENDQSIFEREPMENLAKAKQLEAFKHLGFWRPMDTLNDKTNLESLWQSGSAPWAIWRK